jgi:hypothetical protein
MHRRLRRIWDAIRGNPGLFEAMALAIAAEINLRRLSFDELLSRTHSHGDAPFAREMSAEATRRTIALAFRLLPFEPTCLKEALVFCEIYRRRGLAAELRIGVRKSDSHFAAHAWVEDGAGVVLTDPLDGFSSVSLPASRAIRAGKASG